MSLRLLFLLLISVGAGCASSSRPPAAPDATAKEPDFGRVTKVSEPMLTCSEATRTARDAVVRLGYNVATVEAATPDKPGTVVGRRDSGWSPATPEAGTTYTLRVIVRCSDAGSEFEAATDEGITTQLRFPNAFSAAIRQRAEVKPRQMIKTDDEPQGLIVAVEPLRGSASQRELGADLPAAGITPVKISIINRTQRHYRFRVADVLLTAVQGGHEKPLSPQAAAQRAAPAGSAALQEKLAQKQITDADIAPSATLSGLLYFKASAYKRARVEMLDVEAGETEGFGVEF